jgi:hypothetical protein
LKRVGQIWENMAGLIVLVLASSLDGRRHKVLVLKSWSYNGREGDWKPGVVGEWTEDYGRPWEDGPSVRIV